MDAHFGQTAFSLDSLFLDERLKVLETMLNAANAELEASSRQAYERTAPLVRSLMKLGTEPPASFLNHCGAGPPCAAAACASIRRCSIRSDVTALLEEAKFWQVELNKKELEDALRQAIEKLAKESRNNPGDLKSLRRFAAAVDLASKLSFDINYYQTQNIYYELLQNGYPPIEAGRRKGREERRAWIEEFKDLGKKLSVRVD